MSAVYQHLARYKSRFPLDVTVLSDVMHRLAVSSFVLVPVSFFLPHLILTHA